MKIGITVRTAIISGIMCLGVAPAAHAGLAANGSGVWRFFGNCVDCAIQAERQNFPVTATLTLQNYVQGAALANANFVSFVYDGSNLLTPFTVSRPAGGSITVPNNYNLVTFSGNLTNGGAESFDLAFGTVGGYFRMQLNRSWQTCVANCGGGPSDLGNGGNLVLGNAQTVPEPGTYALMAVGLAIVGYVSRRRQRIS